MTRNWLAKLKSLIGDTAATAAVEFALIAPALVLIPVPVVDIGVGLYTQMEVRLAAQAGAQYALGHAYDSAQITDAATAATPLAVTITTQQSCGCPSGTTVDMVVGTPGACGTCAGGATAGTYVQVLSTATYTPPIAFKDVAFLSTYTLSSTSTVRTQ